MQHAIGGESSWVLIGFVTLGAMLFDLSGVYHLENGASEQCSELNLSHVKMQPCCNLYYRHYHHWAEKTHIVCL